MVPLRHFEIYYPNITKRCTLNSTVLVNEAQFLELFIKPQACIIIQAYFRRYLQLKKNLIRWIRPARPALAINLIDRFDDHCETTLSMLDWVNVVSILLRLVLLFLVFSMFVLLLL